jgi:DNA-binding NtrC family response regulator
MIHQEKLRVLIVEDHTFLRQLLSKAVGERCDVYAASSVKKGWELYLEHTPDIIFLDIKLPDESGHVLARRIKGHQPYSYVVMATASDAISDVEEATRNLVNGFITKPYDKATISGHIDQCLAGRQKQSRDR